MTSTTLDLDAPIVPGSSAGGIRLNTDIRGLLASVGPNTPKELKALLLYDFGPVKVCCSRDRVKQVGVSAGYRGALDGRIRIGSTIAEVEECSGCEVREDDDDNLVVPGSAGWCFETEEWIGHELRDNRSACITDIFVFITDGQGEESIASASRSRQSEISPPKVAEQP